MTGQIFDTTIVASSDKKWLEWPVKIYLLETVSMSTQWDT